jgi:hypothetical protein
VDLGKDDVALLAISLKGVVREVEVKGLASYIMACK